MDKNKSSPSVIIDCRVVQMFRVSVKVCFVHPCSAILNVLIIIKIYTKHVLHDIRMETGDFFLINKKHN